MAASTGNIKNMTIPWLFQDICKARKTGTAVCERDAIMLKVFFRQGDIIFASSNNDDSAMGEFLLGAGRITKEQFDKAAKIMSRSGKKLGAVLFEMGVLAPQDLVAQVKLRAKQNILSLFNWREGTYRFEDNVLTGAEIVPFQMSTVDLIMESIQGLDWQEIRTLLPPLNTVIRKVSDHSPLFQSFQLESSDRTVISLIDGNSSIQDICEKSTLGDLKTLTSLYTLLSLRIAEKAAVKDQEVKEILFREERDTFVPAGAATPDFATSEALVNRELLQNTYDSLDLQDYYAILGISRTATPAEIKRSYFRLSKLYHPDRYTDPQYADMKQKLNTLFERINEAYQVLRDKAKRDQYNLDVASGIKRYGQEEKQPIDKHEADKAAAAAKFAEGMKHLRAQNFWGAEEVFRGAARLEPSKAEYVHYLGMALARMPRRSADAEEYLVNAVKLAPSHIEYYLELGNYYMKSGDKAKALPVFQAALKRDPNSEKIKQAVKAAGG